MKRVDHNAQPRQGAIPKKNMRPEPITIPDGFAQGHDLSVDHTRARAARLDANHLRNCVEQAIKSAGLAYEFSPGSYTADTLADVTALRNLVAIVIERLAAALPEDEA